MDVSLQSVKKPVLIKKQITPYKRPVFLRIFCVSYFCKMFRYVVLESLRIGHSVQGRAVTSAIMTV